jgi:hypothetical protein
VQCGPQVLQSTNVRFWGYSGHCADVLQCLLMTQSGHPRSEIAVLHNTDPAIC